MRGGLASACMTIFRFVFVFVFSAFALSACKKEAPPAAPEDEVEAQAPSAEAAPQAAARAAAVDPCSLLTADELVASLGEAVQAEHSTSGGAQVCTWTAPSGRSVIVQFFSSTSDFDASKQTLERFYEGTALAVPGLGEQAFSIGGKTGPFATASVSATKSGRFVIVQVMDPAASLETLQPEALDLTKPVLTRI